MLLGNHALRFPQGFADCFDAAGSSFFTAEPGFDAVCAFMATGPLVADVIARWVEAPPDGFSLRTRAFIAGWVVGYCGWRTAPGLSKQTILGVRDGRAEIDERGQRWLREAAERGWLPDDPSDPAPASVYALEGWWSAVAHWGSYVEGDCG